jgi:hypothetical protein
MNKPSFWKKYKGFVIGLVIAALVVSAFIPAKIGIPGRSIDDYENDGYDLANIILLEKTEDAVVFEVLATPSNFQVRATLDLDDEVEIGARGVVAGYKELVFDGSYEHRYRFFFPRNGNFLQKLLTTFGLFNFNPPYEGHVEGRASPSLSSSSATTGESYSFGDYSWRMLATSDGRALIITEDIIEVRRFDEESNDWGSSEIRRYLNDDFYNQFSPDEQQLICDTNLADVGTSDKVFLLSVDEVQAFFTSPEDCYAAYRGIEPTDSDGKPLYPNDMERWWWLRTPGASGIGVSLAGSEGCIWPDENNVSRIYYGIRPVLLIQTASTSEDNSPQTPSEPATLAEPQIPSGAISWTEASQHIGETVTIYGTIVEATYASSSSGKPTFINIGAVYPDKSGVSIVIWEDYRSRFSSAPEVLYSGKTVCVTGEIYLYRDACYIEVQSPSQIKVIE